MRCQGGGGSSVKQTKSSGKGEAIFYILLMVMLTLQFHITLQILLNLLALGNPDDTRVGVRQYLDNKTISN